MKTEESKSTDMVSVAETIPLSSLTEEQIQYFASQLRKEYEFLEVEESEVFVRELSELMKVFCFL